MAVNKALAKVFLSQFQEKQHLANWIDNFLDLRFPDSFVDPDSNSSPIDWMYEVYAAYRDNRGNEMPSVITVSSRESYKTLTESVLAVILMVHFNATVCHMAAIVPQATAAQKYISNFTMKIEPYLNFHKRELSAQNAKEISIKNEDGTTSWMKIVVCTITGANSSHSNILCVDEVDTIRNAEGIRAFGEAEFIPGVFNGQHPITIKTSTMKFPGGLFTKELDKARKEKWPIFRWNIIDITEKCPTSRHRPDLPHEIVYVKNGLPLKTITESDYSGLLAKEKEEYQKIDAMGGCAKCPLLPVCRGRLATRSESDVGGLWKPIDFTISQFKKTDPDLAEAQLMCWKPSSQGMVYPRFLDKEDGTGNSYTIEQAWEVFTGEKPKTRVEFENLIKIMKDAGVKFYAGVDWGFRHAYSIGVSALVRGEWWLVDAYSVSGLEWDQMLELAKEVRDKYKPKKWMADTAEPMFIKTFNKNRMPCAEFKKDVSGGIGAVRKQIIDATGFRRLKVLKTDRNEIYFKMFAEHTFMLDQLGNITNEPDDGEYADIADQLRYQAQVIFDPKGKNHLLDQNQPQKTPEQLNEEHNDKVKQTFTNWLKQEINNHAQEDTSSGTQTSKNGSIIWDID